MQGKRMIGEHDLRVYLDKWDKKYWATYKVLDILQKVFYRSVRSIGLVNSLHCLIPLDCLSTSSLPWGSSETRHGVKIP